MTLSFPPPQNWQDFEKFVLGVVEVIWEQKGWHFYGRPGQNQSSIDLFGNDEKDRFTGVQCKKKNQTDTNGQFLTHSLLTKKVIEKEIKGAEQISSPKLERLIFATTSSTDVGIQNIVRNIDNERKEKGEFSIDIWFWEDFQVHIERHDQLMNWYYHTYLETIGKYDKDIHFLTMLKQAFNRLAFKRFIRGEENGGDFIQAIKNTQEAITTGKLYNRRGDLITTSCDINKVSKTIWKNSINEIYVLLNQIRNAYQDGIIRNDIREHPTCIEVLDTNLSNFLNEKRADCLGKLNLVLNQASIEPIISELLPARPSL